MAVMFTGNSLLIIDLPPDRASLDVSDPESIKKFSTWLHACNVQLDILLSNAGIRCDPSVLVESYSNVSIAELQTSLLSHDHKAWGQTFAVNTTGHFFLIANLLDLLHVAATGGEGRGCVVITSSCASMHLCTNVDLTSYAASKAATDHLVGMLAAKVGRHGIRVNGINPGCTPPFSMANKFSIRMRNVSELI
jgi:NAD(P)-dependent dehydrogenase (short-subunit alcohol dehydrogenase family)